MSAEQRIEMIWSFKSRVDLDSSTFRVIFQCLNFFICDVGIKFLSYKVIVGL